jgi:acetyl esterase
MPLDPQARAFIKQMEAMNLPPVTDLTPEQARINAKLRPIYPGPDVARVWDVEIPCATGRVPVRFYAPHGTGPHPVLVWIHGGGWVTGDLDITDGIARQLCAGAECLVASVGYSLSPEAKFPKALDECYQVTSHIARHASDFGADGKRIAVSGDSAGGNLAAAVCLKARDEKKPSIAFQLLIYPATDYSFDTPSYKENATGYLLTRDAMRWYWNHYLARPTDARNPYAAPHQCKDLRGLPPALVITAEYDPLRDEGEEYARRLQQAGVPATCTRYDGLIHGFFGRWGAIERALDAIDESCAALRGAFGGK